MNAVEYGTWVHRLSQYEPRSGDFGAEYDHMVHAGVSMGDRVSIAKAARARYEEQAKSRLRRPVCKWTEMSIHTGHLDDYINQMLSAKKFNTEGEKQMEKIDWHKPLQAFKTPGHEIVDAKVYTYKSGRQRVIWVDERVYPVDEQGRAIADINYGAHGARKGDQIVENVPEEKFFVGLYSLGNGRYEITDCGQTTTMGVLNSWKRLKADQPHWIVDTRKKDWTVIRVCSSYGDTESYGLMTKSDAEQRAGRVGGTVVRLRTTPAPADTARYIQLYRRAGTNEAWRINALDGRQEFTWEEADKKSGWNEYVNVKVRD